MQFSTSTIALFASLLLSVSATPVAKSAATTTAAAAGSVLTAAAYNDFQISSGTAGSAESEANALFANIDMNNLASVSASDLKIINGIHDVAEDAETDAFNDAISAASGDAATALQVSSLSFSPLWASWGEKCADLCIERQDQEQGPQVDC